ncbi:MAG: metallophosphoesterase [Gammaproteobacteria bacterium]|nr:metallophosphoesterase [Gammaproteobacteria bacterium]
MQKEYFKAVFVPVISLLLLLTHLFTTPVYAALERQPYLQSVSDTRVVLRWRTTSSATSRVSYGPAVGNLNTNVDNSSSTTEHEVVITGLNPNTKYYYSVGSTSGTVEAGNNANYYFTTAPNTGSNRKIRIWAIGDPGTNSADQHNVRDAYYNLDNAETDVVLTLGDNAYDNGTDSEYTTNFFNVYKDLFRHAPVWATRGNHEKDLAVHETAFTHPKNAEAGGVASGSELYYSFDYGNIHFVCLDSFTSANLNGSAMYTWLENDLASTTQEWIIAFWHHPPYTRSSDHDSDTEAGLKITREKANPILEKYGVDLQLGGHNHFYARTYLINNHYGKSNTFSLANHAIDAGDGRENGDGVYNKGSNPEGAVYVLAGSSGKVNNYNLGHPANYTEDIKLGSMVIDVQGDRMDVRMLRENGSIQDYFTITKSASTNQAPQVNAGASQNAQTGAVINLDGTVSDDGLPTTTLTYSWSKVSGPGTVTFGNTSTVDTTASFSAAGSYVLQLQASDSLLSGSDSVTITVTDAGSNQPPVVDAGSNQNAETGVVINLNGTVSDDGLPGSALTYSWSRVSGPGTVAFGNASTVDTAASFSAAGSYVLQLQASDSLLTGSDIVTIIVTTPAGSQNQAPLVNAGVDQNAVTGATVLLYATVTDDGMPGSSLTYSWSMVSGPGRVRFGNTSAEDTTVRISTPGSYVLRLEASDGALTGSDEITVNISDVVDPNLAPQVDAGPDLNAATGSLNASVTDDGLPDGRLTYSWSLVSGTGNATFGDAGSLNTTVSFSAAGSYVLRLEASDGALSGSDEVTITVPEQANTGGDTATAAAAAAADVGLLISLLMVLLLRWFAGNRLLKPYHQA